MPESPDRLALDLQRSLNELRQERERSRRLLAELEQQSHELERLRSSVSRESNSRLLAEEALDETRDRLQLAVEAAGLALWDWQLDAPTVFLSARWGELVGDVAMDAQWDLDQLQERIHPDDVPRLRPGVRALLGGVQQREVFQHRVRRHDQWVWVETHAMVAEQDRRGHPLRLMGTVADISERKRAELETAHARELAEQASRAKSAFLANMSHEVRTPLNALMGLTRMLAESPLNEEQRNWLALMDSSAQALLTLLNDILDLSRIEAGKLSIEQVPFDLRQAVDEAVGPYAQQARSKPLALSVQIDPATPAWVRGDPGRLRQVLGNLLSNALKFTPRHGRVRVEVKPSEDGASDLLHFVVQDSGIGIGRKQQATIFDAFTQADPSTARRYGGSGLGLAICARLARLMGGSITLESDLGQGSTFSLSLPLPATAAGSVAPASAPAPLAGLDRTAQRHAGRVVLLAEDNPVNELVMRQMLIRLGFTVRVARGGAQAVAQWEQGGLDLILMDVQMPGMSGLEATRTIRATEARRRLVRVPILAVTAGAMAGDRQACLEAGMDGYVTKPVSPQLLLGEVDRVFAETGQRADTAPPPPEAPGRFEAEPDAGPTDHHRSSPQPSVDLDKLRRRLDGDEATLKELAHAMRLDLAERLEALRLALAQRDGTAAVAHAHGLKGSLGSMTAEKGARLAKGLELAARTADWGLFGRALPLMQAEAREIDRMLALVSPGTEPDLFSSPPRSASV